MAHKQPKQEECLVCQGSSQPLTCVSSSMQHSRAPLLVLLSDLLGCSLVSTQLHSRVVCAPCHTQLTKADDWQLRQTRLRAELRQLWGATLVARGAQYPRVSAACRDCGAMDAQGADTATVTAATSNTHRRALRGRRRGVGREREAARTSRDSSEDPHVSTAQLGGTTETTADVTSASTSASDNNECDVEGGNFPGSSTGRRLTTEVGGIGSRESGDMAAGRSNGGVGATSLEPLPQLDNVASCQNGGAIVWVFDDDPALFVGPERLRVGMHNHDKRYQCQYCSTGCHSDVALKMHVRIIHRPLLVYDTVLKVDQADASSNTENIENRYNQKVNGDHKTELNQESYTNVNNIHTGDAKYSVSTDDKPSDIDEHRRVGVCLQSVSSAQCSPAAYACLLCVVTLPQRASLVRHHTQHHALQSAAGDGKRRRS